MRWFLLSTIVMWAATCGQKGPLQLPSNETLAEPGASAALHAAPAIPRH